MCINTFSVWVVVYCKAQREYTVCYRDRNIPSSQGFTCLHQRLTESGSVRNQRNEVGPAKTRCFKFTNKICNEWKKTLKSAVGDWSKEE